MASGLPVIAANAGGLAESVWHEENGLLVHPEDARGFGHAVVSLAFDAERRRTLATSARRTAEQRDIRGEDQELLRQYAALGPPRDTSPAVRQVVSLSPEGALDRC
jgi:glycosyltransferase involved in cell wall biosynthesis